MLPRDLALQRAVMHRNVNLKACSHRLAQLCYRVIEHVPYSCPTYRHDLIAVTDAPSQLIIINDEYISL